MLPLEMMSYIEHELAERVASAEPPPAPAGARVSRQLKHFPIAPEISIAPCTLPLKSSHA